MPHTIGCKHCKGVSQKQFGKKVSTSQERTQTTSPTMFAHSTSYQKERTSLARKEAETLTSTSNHGTISSLNCPNWKLWVYNDGSCTGKAGNFLGTGVYCPQTKGKCYVNSGGVGMTNTINRAELTGIAAALTNKYTKIAMDSACSLSQIRKHLLFPEMQRAHIHSNLLEQILSMIYASPEHICFYKVKAHSGIAGNECAGAIAKHSALHDGGHDVHFQLPAPDGNAYTHLC